MRLPGPFQHCTPCDKNTNHFWVADLTLACGCCNTQTKIAPTSMKRKAVLERMRELNRLEAESSSVKVQNTPEQKGKLKEAQALAELEEARLEKDPRQFRKEYLQEPVPEVPGTEKKIFKVGVEKGAFTTKEFIPGDHGSYIIDRANGEPDLASPPENLISAKIILVDFSKEGDDFFVNPEDKPKPAVKKGWADGL